MSGFYVEVLNNTSVYVVWNIPDGLSSSIDLQYQFMYTDETGQTRVSSFFLIFAQCLFIHPLYIRHSTLGLAKIRSVKNRPVLFQNKPYLTYTDVECKIKYYSILTGFEH